MLCAEFSADLRLGGSQFSQQLLLCTVDGGVHGAQLKRGFNTFLGAAGIGLERVDFGLSNAFRASNMVVFPIGDDGAETARVKKAP